MQPTSSLELSSSPVPVAWPESITELIDYPFTTPVEEPSGGPVADEARGAHDQPPAKRRRQTGEPRSSAPGPLDKLTVSVVHPDQSPFEVGEVIVRHANRPVRDRARLASC